MTCDECNKEAQVKVYAGYSHADQPPEKLMLCDSCFKHLSRVARRYAECGGEIAERLSPIMINQEWLEMLQIGSKHDIYPVSFFYAMKEFECRVHARLRKANQS